MFKWSNLLKMPGQKLNPKGKSNSFFLLPLSGSTECKYELNVKLYRCFTGIISIFSHYLFIVTLAVTTFTSSHCLLYKLLCVHDGVKLHSRGINQILEVYFSSLLFASFFHPSFLNFYTFSHEISGPTLCCTTMGYEKLRRHLGQISAL